MIPQGFEPWTHALEGRCSNPTELRNQNRVQNYKIIGNSQPISNKFLSSPLLLFAFFEFFAQILKFKVRSTHRGELAAQVYILAILQVIHHPFVAVHSALCQDHRREACVLILKFQRPGNLNYALKASCPCTTLGEVPKAPSSAVPLQQKHHSEQHPDYDCSP